MVTTVLLLLSIVASFVYGTRFFGAPGGWTKAVIKTGAVGSLALLAFVSEAPWPLVVALVLSSAGDFFLAHDGEKPFLAGLASFLLAHVVYVVLFRQVGAPFATIGAEPWRLAGAVAMVGLCLGLLGWLWGHLGPMRGAVVAYTTAIVAMVVSALALSGRPTAILGAFAFAISDSCLAAITFRLKEGRLARLWLPLAVWWLYWGAQVAILAGFVRLGG
ncbi:MAG: lysoplasmalogenase [Siculibacillus sp.]|nr:lysoplasmalogenase [Siculibacillus sp.]